VAQAFALTAKSTAHMHGVAGVMTVTVTIFHSLEIQEAPVSMGFDGTFRLHSPGLMPRTPITCPAAYRQHSFSDDTLLSRLRARPDRTDSNTRTSSRPKSPNDTQELFTPFDREVHELSESPSEQVEPPPDPRIVQGLEKRRLIARKHYEPLDRGFPVNLREGSPGPVTGPFLGSACADSAV
jgi:hypothetical protein